MRTVLRVRRGFSCPVRGDDATEMVQYVGARETEIDWEDGKMEREFENFELTAI